MRRRESRARLQSGSPNSVRKAAAASCTEAPGVFFPESSLLQCEEPGRQDREGHVVMPADPGSDLVVGQSCFALGPLEAFFDQVAILGNSNEFGKRDGQVCIGKIEAILGIVLEGAGHQERLYGTDVLLILGLNGNADRLDFHGAHLSRTDDKARPGGWRLLVSPLGGLDEGSLGSLAAAGSALGRRGFQIAYTGVGGHFQKIALLASGQGSAEPSGATKLVVAKDPGVGEAGSILLEELVGDLDLGAEPDLLGNAALQPAAATPAPLLGKVELAVDQGGAPGSDVAEVNPGLAIVHLAQATAPLALDADGVGPLLFKIAAIEDENTLWIAGFLANFKMKLAEHVAVVPQTRPDEVLKEPTFLIMIRGDGLAGLAGEIAQKTLDVGAGMSRLLNSVEPWCVSIEELTEILQAGLQLLARDLRVGKKLLDGSRNGSAHKTRLSPDLRGLSALRRVA